MNRSAGTAVALCLLANAATAKDVWILRGHVGSPACGKVLFWRATALLHNTGDAAARARIVDVAAPEDFAGRETDIAARKSLSFHWWLSDPTSEPLWVTHLSVPDDVVVEGRLEYGITENCAARVAGDIAAGRISLPVYNALDAAGFRRLHPGVDLGDQKARVNVVVYNAGDVTATATITAERLTCDRPNVTQVITVPARRVVQTTIREVPMCTSFDPQARVPFWAVNVTTVVDQPSATWVTTLSNDAAPNVTIGSSQ